jgi:hypothetical protein
MENKNYRYNRSPITKGQKEKKPADHDREKANATSPVIHSRIQKTKQGPTKRLGNRTRPPDKNKSSRKTCL